MAPDKKTRDETVAWSQYLLNQSAAIMGELNQKGLTPNDIQVIGRALVVAAQNADRSPN